MLITLETTESRGSLASSIAGVKQHSIMNPLLWMLGVVGILGAITAFQFREYPWVAAMCLAPFFIVSLVGLGIFVYLAIKNPDKLRSEEYQIKRDMLEYCERTNIAPEKTVLVLNANPIIEGEK